LAPTLLIAGSNIPDESDVRANTLKYISTITGETEPIIEDFYKFYGPHSEREIAEEMYVCEKIWRLENKYCLKFHHDRFSSKNSRSFYLNRLRNNLPSNPKIQITDVKLEKYDENFCAYKIITNLNELEVEFMHQACELALELGGIVAISKINGVRVDEIIKPRYSMP
jgi:hypothetical protein